jgi:methionyl-tRNA synthetase
MAQKYLITSALPYVNNQLHIGHLIGCLLPSDVYARFCRAMGRDVLYIGGSDEHGTPSEVGALKENMPVEEYVDKYRAKHLDAVRDFNLSFDLYGRTHTKLHEKLIHELFERLDSLDMVYEKSSMQPYSVNEKKFLADRYVIGTCPRCGHERAYGNECDKCGATLDPDQLINPHSATDPNSPVEMRETKHLYFRLSAMQDKLRAWVNSRKGWPKTAVAIANKWLDEGLRDNPITRDLKWGIPVNKPGFEDKVFYVWFDAPWGYVSISQAATDDRASWWKNPDCKYTQFMAKDNISFHSVFFPSQELAMDDNWKTVDVLKGQNFLNFNGAKISKSMGNGIFLDQALSIAPADTWRYALLASAPETDDTDFTVSRFAEIVNKDLNGMLGNFVSRVTKLSAKNFGTRVPTDIKYDTDLANRINAKLDELTNALEACEFRAAIFALRGLFAIGNEYMTETAPWALVKDGKMDDAADVLNECFQLIDLYARVSQPFMPDTAKKMQNIFATTHDLSWPTSFERRVADGEEFNVPENLFERIDDETVAEINEKYSAKPKNIAPIVAKIIDVKSHPKRDDLHVLTVDTGTEKLQIVCGAPNVRPGFVGVLAGVGCVLPGGDKPLAARNVGGVKSNGMMCSAKELGIGNDATQIIELDENNKIGTEYKG